MRARAVEALGRRAGGCDGVALALARGTAGDWTCARCGVSVYATKGSCFNCGAKRVDRGGVAADCDVGAISDAPADNGAYGGGWFTAGSRRLDDLTEKAQLVKSLLCAALYPQDTRP